MEETENPAYSVKELSRASYARGEEAANSGPTEQAYLSSRGRLSYQCNCRQCTNVIDIEQLISIALVVMIALPYSGPDLSC